ncbi:hypothetical protein [Streptomyces parvulus]|uniref:hypothetical protein n=1 Tax=Streptomyces parvulus TaxID=146923 RepID=UPI001CFAF775|nr:hypothetical protein [Streptomyces parvulus]
MVSRLQGVKSPQPKILVTALRRREIATMDLPGHFFNITAMTVSRTANILLAAYGVRVSVSAARFRTPDDVARLLDPGSIKISTTSCFMASLYRLSGLIS